MTTLNRDRARALLDELAPSGFEARVKKRISAWLASGDPRDRGFAEAALDDLPADRLRELYGVAGAGLKKGE